MGRVLGIDPGTRVTGWGVIEPHGPRARLIDTGIIKVSERLPLAERLRRIHAGLAEVIAQHQPASVAVEDIFHAKNARSALVLGHARGVALLVAAQAELEVSAYPPSVVKRTVAGKGNASKEQVALLVGAMLGMRDLPVVDATDALAIAIAHLNQARTRAVFQRA